MRKQKGVGNINPYIFIAVFVLMSLATGLSLGKYVGLAGYLFGIPLTSALYYGYFWIKNKINPEWMYHYLRKEKMVLPSLFLILTGEYESINKQLAEIIEEQPKHKEDIEWLISMIDRYFPPNVQAIALSVKESIIEIHWFDAFVHHYEDNDEGLYLYLEFDLKNKVAKCNVDKQDDLSKLTHINTFETKIDTNEEWESLASFVTKYLTIAQNDAQTEIKSQLTELKEQN